jgi:hypothetical protein
MARRKKNHNLAHSWGVTHSRTHSSAISSGYGEATGISYTTTTPTADPFRLIHRAKEFRQHLQELAKILTVEQFVSYRAAIDRAFDEVATGTPRTSDPEDSSV